ncbi:ANTAR domain-containing protein [Amycolatopsis magusensis]|uniref:ANTAR domain-containing protein n=1 Tax=Amycolatopsis magusensis TaxID=882444 RepID=UPI003C2EA49F
MDVNRRAQLVRAITGQPVSGLLWSRAHAVCTVTARELGLDAAALSLYLEPRIQEPIVTTSSWAARLNDLEYTLGDGPGIAAFHTERAIHLPDLTAALRHRTGYATFAGAEELAAQFCWPVITGNGEPIAVLSGYRRRPGPLSARQTQDSAILVKLLARALEDSDTGLPAALVAVDRGQLRHYATVALAITFTAARHKLSSDDAFALLRAHAFSHGKTLRDIADAVAGRRLDLDTR